MFAAVIGATALFERWLRWCLAAQHSRHLLAGTMLVVTGKLAKRGHDSSASREGHACRSRIEQKNSAFIVSTLTQCERLILLPQY
jgi:hypothetical protein